MTSEASRPPVFSSELARTGSRDRRVAALPLGALVAAAERLDKKPSKRATEGIDSTDWMGLVEEAYDRLAGTPFRAHPLRGFEHTHARKTRLITLVAPVEKLIEEAVRPRLEDALEQRLPDGVHGYRKGRSTWTAAAHVGRFLSEGRHHLLASDVADCFPSLDWEHLRQSLIGLLDERLIDVCLAFARAPIVHDGRLLTRERGIPLGRALSPALLNAYLLPIDEALAAGNVGFVRYADDLLLAAHSEGGLGEVRAVLEAQLAARGLALHATKTRAFVYDMRPIVHLGHHVGHEGILERMGEHRLRRVGTPRQREAVSEVPTTEAVPPQPRTLYLAQHGLYVRVEKSLVQVRMGQDVVREVPLRRIDRILVLGGMAMSSNFVAACIQRRIPIVFFVGYGRAYGALISSNCVSPLRRRAEYGLIADEERRLELASDVVAAKIAAMRNKVRRKGGPHDSQHLLSSALDRVPEAENIETLIGIEGAATKTYFAALALWVKPASFAFTERSRRPPRDPVNSLLSFTYALLFSEIQATLLAHGMDPDVGVLHALHRNHPALASDLLEPYRSAVADPFVLGLVNAGRVPIEGFDRRTNGAVLMKPEVRRTVLDSWEGYMRRPLGGVRGPTPRTLVDRAVLSMLAVVMGEQSRLKLPLPGGSDEGMDGDGGDDAYIDRV